jgi:hypothetical protein
MRFQDIAVSISSSGVAHISNLGLGFLIVLFCVGFGFAYESLNSPYFFKDKRATSGWLDLTSYVCGEPLLLS